MVGKPQIDSLICLDPKPVCAFPKEPWCLLEALSTLRAITQTVYT